MVTKGLARQVYRLLKNISSLTVNQARVFKWDPDDMRRLVVELCPSDGYYKGAKFIFTLILDDAFPEVPPRVFCETPIYHPNIDTTDEDEDGYSVCLSMFDTGEWSNRMGLDECIIGLLYLLYNPNLNDPLSPLFAPDTEEDDFKDNLQRSLEGQIVDGFEFKNNRDNFCKTTDNDSVAKDLLKVLNCMNIHDITESTTVEETDIKTNKTADYVVSIETDITKSDDKIEETINEHTRLAKCAVNVPCDKDLLNESDVFHICDVTEPTVVAQMHTQGIHSVLCTVMKTFLHLAETFFNTPNDMFV